MKKSTLYIAIVTCMAHSGYRRANIGFEKGENTIEGVTADQLEIIDQDERLKIVEAKEVDEPKADNAKKEKAPKDKKADAFVLPEAPAEIVTIDIDEALAPIVKAIHEAHVAATLELTAKNVPNLKSIAVNDAENNKVNITAEELKAAWEIYLTLLPATSDEGAA